MSSGNSVSPILQAVVLADHVYTDRATGKKIIAGVFSKLTCRKRRQEVEGETQQERMNRAALDSVGVAGSPWLYAALTAVREGLELTLRWVHLPTERQLFEMKLQFKGESDPLRIHEVVLALPSLNAGLDGWHAMELLHNDIPLGSLRIYVEQTEQNNE